MACPYVSIGDRVLVLNAENVAEATGKMATITQITDGVHEVRLDEAVTSDTGIEGADWCITDWARLNPETLRRTRILALRADFVSRARLNFGTARQAVYAGSGELSVSFDRHINSDGGVADKSYYVNQWVLADEIIGFEEKLGVVGWQRPTVQQAEYEAYAMDRVLDLVNDDDGLMEAWDLWVEAEGTGCDLRGCTECPPVRLTEFVQLVNETVGADLAIACDMCRKPGYEGDSQTDVDGNIACLDCYEQVSLCSHCDRWSISEYWLYAVDDEMFCDACRSAVCSYCDRCGTYYTDEYEEDHDHEPDFCTCSPLDSLEFLVPAKDYGVLAQDERLLVEVGKGEVSEEAINAVINLIWLEQLRPAALNFPDDPVNKDSYQKLCDAAHSLERIWQTKRGNFTRRLSKALYDNGIKLDSGLLSRAGALVKEHSGRTSKWYIELTRDLNQPAEAFYHSGSCWWGGENSSLCAFKHWGGIGMRSYDNETAPSDCPNGRVWVQPLDIALQPTLEVHDAHAYVVYNGYGALDGYAGARIMAWLTSRTYKKIRFSASYQYINSGGYLVADEETCNRVTEIAINHLSHHQKVAA